jgi:O-antigen ligase
MADHSVTLPAGRTRTQLGTPLIVLAMALGAAFVAAGEPLAGGILIATPLLPFLYYALIRGIAGDYNFGPLLATAIIFVLSANFRYREITEKSIDFQVALKILAICGSLGFSVLFFRQIVKHLYLYGLAYWLGFYGVLLFSATYAMTPLHAGVSTVSLIGSFLFLCYLCVKYGPDRMVEILVWTGLVMCVASIAVYFAVPEFGRMKNWYGNDLVLTSRLQGLFGASNGAGCGAATLLFLTIFFYMGQPGASRLVGWMTIIAASVCLIMSINRMAMGAFLVSSLVYFLVTGNFGRKLLLLISLGVLVVVPVLLFPEAVFELVSRSGDAEEVTSGTGRTRIWAVVLDLIPKSWLIGYGYASAQYILPTHPDLFEAAAHSHNLYLEMLFCSGVVGFFMLLWCLLTTIILAIRVGGARELGLFVFFIPYGLTEPVIGGVTYLAMIMWQASVVLLFYRAKRQELAAAGTKSTIVPGFSS